MQGIGRVRLGILFDVHCADKRKLGHYQFVSIACIRWGHLLFLLIEKIKGSPVSERVQDFSYRIGAMALILLMGLALFNDFSRF